MSLQSALDFLNAIEENAELAAEVAGKGEADGIAIAAAHGYEFSVEELREATDEVFGELSEEELEGVAGGWRFHMP